MELSFTTLDVFTASRYAGNPVALVFVPHSLSHHLTQAQKQAIAKEFNLSETVFLHLKENEDEDSIRIDIFTCHAEVPFAGHPTIGSAYHVLTSSAVQPKALVTKAGRIPISLDNKTGMVRAEVPHDVRIHAMKVRSSWTEEPSPVVSIVKGMTFILASLDSLPALSQPRQNINTDTYDPTGLDPGWETGIITTYFYVLLGTDEAGCTVIRSRMFGTREDPATGSAASALCSYLALREDREKGKGPFAYSITQGVEMGRESHIGVEVLRTEDGTGVVTVALSGKAVDVMKGQVPL